MIRAFLIASALVVSISACGGGRLSSEPAVPGADNSVTVHVQNDFNAGVEISTVWGGDRTRSRLGLVGRGESADFTFFYRVGDLRIVVGSQASRRTATSNPVAIVNRMRGQTLNLVIDDRFGPELYAPRQ